MPYGSNLVTNKVGTAKIYNITPSGSTARDVGGTPYSSKEMWQRSGQNGLSGTICKRWPHPMKLVSIELPLGNRLPYKVTNPKTGKLVWARKPIKVWKLKRDLSAKPFKLITETQLPHPLSYQSVIFSALPSANSVLATHVSYPTYQKKITGDLWDNISWFGGQTLPFPPEVYVTQRSLTVGRIAKEDKKALAKLYSRVKDQQVNLLNAIGERKQTLKMLEGLIKKLFNIYKLCKRGNFVGAASELLPGSHTDVSNFWLMLTYGIKPLISDINGLIDHLNKYPSVEFDVKVGSTGSETIEEPSSMSNGVKLTANRTTISKVTVTYKVRLKLKEEWERNFTRLGLTNLNATAWELIPWSFILDWALPIGEYLNSEDAFGGLETVFCTKTVFSREDTIVYRRFEGVDSDGYRWDYAKSGYVTTKVHVERTLLSSPPKLPPPSFKNPLSRPHGYNLVALLSQLSH